MKILKKICSSLLACALVLSCAVTSAGAAFTDQDSITNKAAVDTLVSLNVISGKSDGSFDPAALVTRAELAKMACHMIYGGKPSFEGAITEPLNFTDVPQDHWAINFIRFCASQKIISGREDGTFDPEAPVTSLEAAKMLLICVGYLPEVVGLTGEGWAEATEKKATEVGLLPGLYHLDLAAPLSRDATAQLLSNALNVPMVEYDFVIIEENGKTTTRPQLHPSDNVVTMLTRYFGQKDDA